MADSGACSPWLGVCCQVLYCEGGGVRVCSDGSDRNHLQLSRCGSITPWQKVQRDRQALLLHHKLHRQDCIFHLNLLPAKWAGNRNQMCGHESSVYLPFGRTESRNRAVNRLSCLRTTSMLHSGLLLTTVSFLEQLSTIQPLTYSPSPQILTILLNHMACEILTLESAKKFLN